MNNISPRPALMNKKSILFLFLSLFFFQINAADLVEKMKKDLEKITRNSHEQSIKERVLGVLYSYLRTENLRLNKHEFSSIALFEKKLRAINKGRLGGVSYETLDEIADTIKDYLLQHTKLAVVPFSNVLTEINFVESAHNYIIKKLEEKAQEKKEAEKEFKEFLKSTPID